MKNPSIQVNKDEYNKDDKFSPKITSPALEVTNIQDDNVGLHLFLHGGTHPTGVGSELTIFFCSLFCYSWFRLQSMAIHCNRRGVSRGDHLFGCSCWVCRRSNTISVKTEEHSKPGHAKGASVSTFSSHSRDRADPRNIFHFGKLVPRGCALLPNSENCVAHWAHVGNRHSCNIQLQSMRATQKKGVHLVRHSRFVRVSKGSMHFSPRRILVDRYTSHETFSQHFHPCAHHIVAQGVARRVCIKRCSCTCHHMFKRLLFPCFVFFFCLSCLYFFSHFYLFSVLNFNFHVVETAEH